MAYNFSTGFVASTLANISGILAHGVIEVYSGPRPVSGDAATKGTLLGVITASGLPFEAGSPANGLLFETDAVEGVISKDPAQVWQFKALASGTAGWLRIKSNAVDTGGVSTTAVRIDGSIAAFGGDATIEGSTMLEVDKVYTINSCSINWGNM